MVFLINRRGKKDYNNDIKRDENEEDIKGKMKQEEQQKAGKSKQPLPSLPDRKKVHQVPDRNKGKELLTQVSSLLTFNGPKIGKKPVKSNIPVKILTQTPRIISSCPTTHKPRSLGPFGGEGGVAFDDGTFTGVRQLTIASGLLVDSISFEYDNNGCSVTSRHHGGSGGHNKNTITLDYPDEFLISTCGYIYESGTLVVVGSLTIQSNTKTYGPFGVEQGKKFSFPSTGGKIIGFHGKSGQFLDAIGAYFEPITQNPPSSMSVGPFGGRGGVSFDDGTFTGVRQLTIASGLLVDSISFEYDNNGSSVTSRHHGGSGGHNKNTITLDYPDEFLISACGYIYESGSLVVVGSLTIQSNTKTYGPFGVEQGKKFSFPSTGGKIIGFHGKSGQFLDAIGAYFEPITYNPPSSV